MAKSFSGGCACGAIRYEFTGEPSMMFECHCRDCQRVTGSGFAAAVIVPAKAFKLIKGAPRYYSTSSLAGGENKRGFCPDCGSPLFGAGDDEIQGIHASSLDDPSLFKPQFDIWTSDAQPWDSMDSQLPKFEKYPPQA